MKNILLLFTLLLACCQPGGPITQADNEDINKEQSTKLEGEVRHVISSIFESAKLANAEQVLEEFWNSPEFVYISMTGEVTDYRKFEEIVKQNYDGMKTEVFSKGKEKFTFIGETAVMWTYHGSVTVTYENENELKVDPVAITMILKEVNQEWKVTYLHESGQLPHESQD